MSRLRFALALGFVMAVGCAEAGTGEGGGDETPDAAPVAGDPDAAPVGGTPDAQSSGPPDAMRPIDAAPVVTTPDAGGLFCTTSATCPTGECCLTFGGPNGFCVPGEEVPIVGCVPE